MKHLKSPELLEETKVLVKKERETLFLILKHLEEIELRDLHLSMGYGSMTEFGVKYLNYSEPEIQRRLAAMHTMRGLPEIQEKVEAGTISMTTLTSAARAFNRKEHTPEQKNDILKSLEHLPTREVEKVLNLQSNTLSFYADEALRQELEELKNLWGCNLSNAIKRMTQVALKERKTKPTPERPETRVPSEDLKRRVRERDQNCTFLSKDGRRCGSSFNPQYDHILPWALGGQTTFENLRLLCGAHNRFNARETFGRRRNYGSPKTHDESKRQDNQGNYDNQDKRKSAEPQKTA